MITLEKLECFRAMANEIHGEVTRGEIDSSRAFANLLMECEECEIDASELIKEYDDEVNEIARKYYTELRSKLGLSRRRNVSR